jgi:hypothetical protein
VPGSAEQREAVDTFGGDHNLTAIEEDPPALWYPLIPRRKSPEMASVSLCPPKLCTATKVKGKRVKKRMNKDTTEKIKLQLDLEDYYEQVSMTSPAPPSKK